MRPPITSGSTPTPSDRTTTARTLAPGACPCPLLHACNPRLACIILQSAKALQVYTLHSSKRRRRRQLCDDWQSVCLDLVLFSCELRKSRASWSVAAALVAARRDRACKGQPWHGTCTLFCICPHGMTNLPIYPHALQKVMASRMHWLGALLVAVTALAGLQVCVPRAAQQQAHSGDDRRGGRGVCV